MKQLQAPNGRKIIATKDLVPGVAWFNGVTVDKEGNIQFEYEGETELDWDGQYTVTKDGEPIVYDEDFNEFKLSECKLVDEEDELVGEDAQEEKTYDGVVKGQADLIFAEIANNKQPLEGELPLIFNGEKPRWLGLVESFEEADAVLIANNCSATYLSRAEVKGLRCIIAHG